jgi:hypothetical protein
MGDVLQGLLAAEGHRSLDDLEEDPARVQVRELGHLSLDPRGQALPRTGREVTPGQATGREPALRPGRENCDGGRGNLHRGWSGQVAMQRRLSFLHAEPGPLIARALVSVTEQRPVSHATTHQHVTELYRHFAVGSRAQLMAYVLKRIVGDNVRVV